MNKYQVLIHHFSVKMVITQVCISNLTISLEKLPDMMLGQTSGANVSPCQGLLTSYRSPHFKARKVEDISADPGTSKAWEWKLWMLWFVRGLGQFHDRKQIFVPWSKLVGSTRLVHGNPTLDRDGDQNHRELVPQIGIQIGIQRSSVDLGLEAAFPFGHGLTYTTFEPLSSKLLVEILQLIYHIQCFCRKIPQHFVHL